MTSFPNFHRLLKGAIIGVDRRFNPLASILFQQNPDTLWLSPVQKSCQYHSFTDHGNGIEDFLQIDPRFASDPAAAKSNRQVARNESRDQAHTLQKMEPQPCGKGLEHESLHRVTEVIQTRQRADRPGENIRPEALHFSGHRWCRPNSVPEIGEMKKSIL